MLSYNELKPGIFISMDNEPFEIVEYDFLRMQQRKPVAQVKMKSLISGNTRQETFHQSDKIEEADINYKKIKFLYVNRGEYWFCEESDPKVRFSFKDEQLGFKSGFLKPNTLVDAMVFNSKIINIRLPIKMEFEVIESPPGVKGDTAQGGSKQVKLESGAYVNVPLFINQGDIIKVNTETGEYTERAEKVK